MFITSVQQPGITHGVTRVEFTHLIIIIDSLFAFLDIHLPTRIGLLGVSRLVKLARKQVL